MRQCLRAEEDLRIIRSLMERATIYRAISAPTALVGGTLSIMAAVAIHFSARASLPFERLAAGRDFAIVWLLVLALTVISNTFFVWREAQKSGRPFVSSGMKLALRAIAPCLLIPTAFTCWFLGTGYLGGQELELVTVWIAFYGLALLSTALFAPRSLALLGWAFLLTSVAAPTLTTILEGFTDNLPNLAMAVTFGGYHILYAVCTWSRQRAVAGDEILPE